MKPRSLVFTLPSRAGDTFKSPTITKVNLMRMIVQFVASLALLCSTRHFLSAQLVPRSANTWAYFSHIADGGGWQTTFTVSNPNWNPVSVTIDFRDTEGGDLYLDLGYGPWTSVEFEIPRHGTVEFAGNAAGPDVRVGWATLRASNSVQGVATYSALENGSPRYSISVPASLPTTGYFSAATPDLGIAVGKTSTPLRCPSSSRPHPTTGPRPMEP